MNKDISDVRVRIAPSPTGNLHVGTARAALFNELFARQHNGSFVIRIEDTDQERSKPAFEENILEGLEWLGLTWDEGPDKAGDYGPYRQSERRELHQQALQQLLDSGAARQGEGETIVLNVEPQEVVFQDIVRGEVTVHTDSFEGSFIIARSPKDPLFHLAVVADDAAMNITHVIRGEDHLHNTAKHILIQRALGYKTPIYAHLPLLLDEKRAKLSKRSGETSLLAYRDRGYLPAAMLNYLALLGWNGGDDRELFSHEELIEGFSLERVQKAGAIFSMHKLDSLNKQYLTNLSDEELLQWGEKHYEQANISIQDDLRLLAALKTELGRFSSYNIGDQTLSDVMRWYEIGALLQYDSGLLVWRKSDAKATAHLLLKLGEKLSDLSEDQFTLDQLEKELLEWIDSEDLGRGDTLWPMRVALTGREHSPGPFEVASILGKEETVTRIRAAQERLTATT